MNVFITGATGFLGRHLVKALKADGVSVSTLIRPWGYRTIYEQLYQRRPDVVIHLAAHYCRDHVPQDIEALLAANVGLPTVLCEAMRARGLTRLVTIGTAWQDYNAWPNVPANLYAATKSAADALVAYYVDAHEFRVVNLRLINLYGDGDTRKTLLTQLHDGMALTEGEQFTSFTPVEDAVAAIRAAIERTGEMNPGRATYAVWPDPKPLREWIALLRPNVKVIWGVKPYRAREPMCLPTHHPTLETHALR